METFRESYHAITIFPAALDGKKSALNFLDGVPCHGYEAALPAELSANAPELGGAFAAVVAHINGVAKADAVACCCCPCVSYDAIFSFAVCCCPCTLGLSCCTARCFEAAQAATLETVTVCSGGCSRMWWRL